MKWIERCPGVDEANRKVVEKAVKHDSKQRTKCNPHHVPVFTTTFPTCFAVGEYLLLLLRYGPYLMNSSGIGIMTSERSPRSVDAQRGFSLSYMLVANSGKVAPKEERKTVLAAMAVAATCR